MIKIALGILIILFTSFCGYMFSKKYRQKKLFFFEMNEFNERYLSEINYYKRPLGEFMSKYTYKGEFLELLNVFIYSLQNKDLEKDTFSNYSFLTNDEKVFIYDYFLMLGRGDSASQKSYFTSVKTTLADYKTKSAENAKRYGDLYLKLGFLFGLTILVLII